MVPVNRPVCGGLSVGTVVSYFDHKRRAKGGKAQHVDPVIAEILEALLVLGGCAHRQMVADQIARTVAAPAELPIGIVTAAVGAPVFLWMLMTSAASEVQ